MKLNFTYSDELYHYGVKGMKWGVRKKRDYARRNFKKSKKFNLSKWGKDEDHNVLYITGVSGSGKSTLAKGIAKNNDRVIHLDPLLENNRQNDKYNKEFRAYLSSKGIDYRKASNLSIPRKERWKILDDIGDQIEPFGRSQFQNGSRVIVEGVQLGDQTLFPDKDYFKGRPLIVTKSNYIVDTIRGGKRDGVSPLKLPGELVDKERINWYRQIDQFSKGVY